MQIEGKNPVLESLRAGNDIEEIIMNVNLKKDDKVSEIIKLAKKNNIKIKWKNVKTISKIAETNVHQGIIAYRDRKPIDKVNIKEYTEMLYQNKLVPFFVFIRDVYNEYNVGSIVRSAEASGANAVILPPKNILTPQMVRASMGGTEHIPVFNMGLFDTIKSVQKEGLKVIAIEVTGDKYYFEEDLTGPVMLIIGGEDRSISDSISSKCDTTVKIPLQGELNSLNMATAASIVMFEKTKQELI